MLRSGLQPARTVFARPSLSLASRIAVRANSTNSAKNDDRLIGDYPDVKFEYYQHRDPKVKYFDQQNKRAYDEPLHYQHDLLDVWSPDRFDLVSNSTALRWQLYFVAGVLSFSGFIYYFFYPEPPAVKRNYPHGGLYKALGGTEADKEIYQASVDKEA